ncbi:MAG: SGNH/GDSL hydrolase family protein [Clostridiales bacterium]
MKTVFMGDSLTEGLPGVGFWRFLTDKSNLINKGLGGDTLIGLTKRTKKLLKKDTKGNIEKYIIEIGTNDVLLPVLKNHSWCWRTVVKIKAKVLGCVPCENIGDFQDKYEKLLVLLLKNQKQIGIIGLPFIETTAVEINPTMEKYDDAIKELAQKYHIDYVDFRELEKALIGKNKATYFFGKTNFFNMLDVISTSILPFSMFISKSRQLNATTDSVHLNEKAAKKLACLIEEKLL